MSLAFSLFYVFDYLIQLELFSLKILYSHILLSRPCNIITKAYPYFGHWLFWSVMR